MGDEAGDFDADDAGDEAADKLRDYAGGEKIERVDGGVQDCVAISFW